MQKQGAFFKARNIFRYAAQINIMLQNLREYITLIMLNCILIKGPSLASENQTKEAIYGSRTKSELESFYVMWCDN
jgi:hypothetical protein